MLIIIHVSCLYSVGEPDSPVLSVDKMKVEGNTFSVPLKQNDDGGTPLLHFDVRYKQVRDAVSLSLTFSLNYFLYIHPICSIFILSQDKEGTEWEDKQLPSDADSVSLKDLSYGSDYQLEVKAVNANGSSIPAMFNFTIAEKPGMWTGLQLRISSSSLELSELATVYT